MADYIRSSLLTVVEEHLRATGMSVASLGLAALNDPHFVSQLRRGRQPQHSTAHRLLDYVIADMERRLEQYAQRKHRQDCLAERDAIIEEAGALCVEAIKRTVMMPAPVDPEVTPLRIVGGYA